MKICQSWKATMTRQEWRKLTKLFTRLFLAFIFIFVIYVPNLNVHYFLAEFLLVNNVLVRKS